MESWGYASCWRISSEMVGPRVVGVAGASKSERLVLAMSQLFSTRELTDQLHPQERGYNIHTTR